MEEYLQGIENAIRDHTREDGSCAYGYTDGFYWEGECPLCGRDETQGEAQ